MDLTEHLLPCPCWFTKSGVKRKGILRSVSACGNPPMFMGAVQDIETGKCHVVPWTPNLVIVKAHEDEEYTPEAT